APKPKSQTPKKSQFPKAERRLQKSHLSGIRTLCSPSPLPSPSGRGSIVGSAFENPSRLELLQRGPWFSLSLRERAGVRGNGPWEMKNRGKFCNCLPDFGFLNLHLDCR